MVFRNPSLHMQVKDHLRLANSIDSIRVGWNRVDVEAKSLLLFLDVDEARVVEGLAGKASYSPGRYERRKFIFSSHVCGE